MTYEPLSPSVILSPNLPISEDKKYKEIHKQLIHFLTSVDNILFIFYIKYYIVIYLSTRLIEILPIK